MLEEKHQELNQLKESLLKEKDFAVKQAINMYKSEEILTSDRDSESKYLREIQQLKEEKRKLDEKYSLKCVAEGDKLKEIRRLKTENAKLNLEITNNTEQANDKLLKKNQELTSTVAKLEAELTDLKTTNEKLLHEVDLRSTAEHREDEVLKLRKRNALLVLTIQQVDDKANRLNCENIDLNLDGDDQERELYELFLSRLQNKEVKKLKQQVRWRDEEIESISFSLEAYKKASNQALPDEISKELASVKDLRTKLKQIDRNRRQLSDQNNKQSEKIVNLSKKYQDILHKQETQQSILNEKDAFIKDLQRNISDIQEKYEILNEENNSLKLEIEDLKKQLSFGSSKEPSKPLLSSKVTVYIAKYDYDPIKCSPNDNPELELGVSKGDYIYVWGDMDSDGFFYGENLNQKRGLVPSNFIERVPSSEVPQLLKKTLHRLSSSTVKDNESGESDSENTSGNLTPTMVSFLESNPANHKEMVLPPRSIEIEERLPNTVIVSWQLPRPIGNIQSFCVCINGSPRKVFLLGTRTKTAVNIANDVVTAVGIVRISVRSVTESGLQSLDQQCCYVVYYPKRNSKCPLDLRASKVTSSSVFVEWHPASSTLAHAIYLNDLHLCTVPSGVFTKSISNLHPGIAYQITVRAVVDEMQCSESSSIVLFETLSLGIPPIPRNLSISRASQPDSLYISWTSLEREDVKGYRLCDGTKTLAVIDGIDANNVIVSANVLRGCNNITLKSFTTKDESPPSAVAQVAPDAVLLISSELRNASSEESFELSDIAEESDECSENIASKKQSGKDFNRNIFPRGASRYSSDSKVGRSSKMPPSFPKYAVSDDESAKMRKNKLSDHLINKHVVALLDFDPSTMTSSKFRRPRLPVKAGQVLLVIDVEPDGNIKVESRSRKRGLVPSNLVLPLVSQGDAALGSRLIDRAKNMQKMYSLFPYNPAEDSPNPDPELELKFSAGEIIYVFGSIDEDGFFVGERYNGDRGLVPSNFLQKFDLSRHAQRQSPYKEIYHSESYVSDATPFSVTDTFT